MGASVSSNITKIVTTAIVNASTETIQKINVSQDQSILINVEDTQGDVIIKDNVFIQKATLNLNTLSSILTTNAMQNKIDSDIAQMAKSIISGLNLAQLADASNLVNSVISSSINIKNQAIQDCFTSTNQTLEINVQRTQGNVYIEKIVSTQLNDHVNSCVQNAASNNNTISDLESKIKQASTSEAKGLSLEFIVLIIVAMGGTGLGGVYIGSKIVFPAILIMSILSFILYTQWTIKEISSYPFSSLLITESQDCIKPTETETPYTSARLVSEACLNDPDCQAYQWYNNKGILIKTPLNDSCISYYKNASHLDHQSTIVSPIFLSFSTDPQYNNLANVYLNSSNGTLFVSKGDGVWESKGPIINYGSTVTWGKGDPIDRAIRNTFYVNYTDPSKFVIYIGDGANWNIFNDANIKGIEPIIDSKAESSKFVGFVVKSKRPWLLYLSIGLFVVGLIGLFVMNKPDKK